jgi:type IV secretory pathway TrbD component
MKKLRRLTIHRSLMRPILLAGGERKLVMINYTIIATLLFGAGLNTFSVITALALATLGHISLVKLGNYDSQFSQIYSRYRYYRDWYSAQSNQLNSNHPVKPAVSKGVRP